MHQETHQTAPLFRSVELRNINQEGRTASLSFASDYPVERFFGIEILDQSPTSVRMERMQSGAPLLMDHDHRDVVGVIESATFENGRGEAVVRFSKSARAEEIFQDVRDGIRSNVSVGYRVHKAVLEEQSDDGDTYRVTDWEPIEVSLVSVPADPSVGVGRSEQTKNTLLLERDNPQVEISIEEESPMSEEANAPEVDVRAVESAALEKERKRSSAILRTGAMTGETELAQQFVDNGRSVEDFQAAVLERIADVSQIETPDPSIGLTDKEKRQFSFTRAIHALANPQNKRAQEAAAFERECSEAAEQVEGIEGNGIRVPYDVLVGEKRDLVVGTPTAGGNVVSTDLLASSFIELLRNRTQVVQAGATVLDGLQGNIAIPQQTGGATAYWVNESGSPTESQQSIDQVAMTPKTVGAYTDFSRKLMLQSSIGVEAFVRSDLTRVLGIEKDRVALNGSGADPEPRGVLQTTGIGAIAPATNGQAPTWEHIVGLETELAADNADVGAMSYFVNARGRGRLKTTLVDSGSGQFIWPVNGTQINGYGAFTTNQVPGDLTQGTGTNLSAIIFGNWNDLLIGEWGGISLMVDPYTHSTSGTIRVVVLHDCDIAVRHPESFAAMTDAITA